MPEGAAVLPARAESLFSGAMGCRVAATEANEIIHVIPRSTYTFQGAVGSTQTLVLRKHIPTVRFAEFVLVMRVHAITATGTQSFGLDIFESTRSREDPQALFLNPLGLEFGDNPSFGAGTPVPKTTISQGVNAASEGVRVVLIAIQDDITATTMSCALSVDLVCRSRS